MAYVTLGYRLLVFFVNENKTLVKGDHAVESNLVVIVAQDPESDTLRIRGHANFSEI